MHECQFHEKSSIQEKIVFPLNNFHLFNCILEAYIYSLLILSISTTFIISQRVLYENLYLHCTIFLLAHFVKCLFFFKEEKCQSQTSSRHHYLFSCSQQITKEANKFKMCQFNFFFFMKIYFWHEFCRKS